MIPTPTFIYHITHLDNLARIISEGCIYSCCLLHENRINHVNIAHQSIQNRRALTQVPHPPYGTLHDYVPFYFAPRSPMLLTINKGNVEGYSDGQRSVIHLVSTVQIVSNAKLPFVFSDGHGIIYYTTFYKEINDLDKIDWDIMSSNYWADTINDLDRKRRRQAELLVYKSFPWQLIWRICVLNERVAQKVNNIMTKSNQRPQIIVRPDWYY